MAKQKPQPHSKPLPLEVGGFAVVRLLGEGGMGNVYACKDESLGRLVAIKVLKQNYAAQPQQAARFMREARAMAKIQSPNVVTVYQVGQDQKAPFLVMEILEGEDLSERIKKGPIAERQAVKYIKGTIRGLRDARDAGVIHRDVKPANLFVVDGVVKLTDFGLSLSVDADAKLTQEGLVVGTPHYLAPELARGGAASQASDIYALGATFYELVVGHPPYPGKAALDVVSAHLHKPVPRPREERPELSRGVEKLIMKMMAKKQEDRFATYEELEKAIRTIEYENAPTQVSALPLPTMAQPSRIPDDMSKEVAAPSSSSLMAVSARPLPKQTLVVMYIEIDKYNQRISGSNREVSGQWLALHDSLLQPVFRAYGGKRIKSVGDGILVTFTSPTDAVKAGMALQDQLAQHNQNAIEPDHIHARVSLSAGEVQLLKNDIIGAPVNLATRLETMAQNRDVVLSDAVFAMVASSNIALASLGEHRFKDEKRRVSVYRVVSQAVGLPYGGATLGRVEQEGRALGSGIRRAVSATFDAGPDTFVYKLRQSGLDLRPLIFGGIIAALAGVGIMAFFAFYEPQSPAEAAKAQVKAFGGKRVLPIDEEKKLAAAYQLLGQKKRALARYAHLRERGVDVEGGDRLAFSLMADKDAKEAIEYLAESPTAGATLRALVREEDWWLRHNALVVLDKKGEVDDKLRQEVALRDLEYGDTCGRRKWGARLLSRIGTGAEALSAIRVAQSRADNGCMTRTLEKAERNIGKRQ